MSKLFTRARTSSGIAKTGIGNAYSDTDEFGRSTMVPKKEKRALDKGLRQRTLSNPNLHAAANDRPETPRDLPMLPDGLFLPTSLTAPVNLTDDLLLADHKQPEAVQEYGYMHYEKHVVLALDEVVRLVDVVAEELGQRGLTTPLLFSPLAIDIRPNVIRRLVSAFIATCPHHLARSSTETHWREEARFAAPHDLAMLLRWGLARIVRLEKGVEVRGFITWENYMIWRQSEESTGYSPNHFSAFTYPLDAPVRTLFTSLFHLLSRFAANATSSGLTPSQLATLFGPLIFGLGNPSLTFGYAYSAYLRAAHATEHLLLSFIRWQEAQTQLKGAMPARLRDWVRGYPSMIAPLARLEKARRGTRLIRLSSVRRNVRLYSADLVKNAASWSVPRGSFQSSKEWARIAPTSLKLAPKFSDSYRKLLSVQSSFHPDMGPGANTLPDLRTPDDEGLDYFHEPASSDDNSFRSLTDLRWGAFENLGFSDTDKNKLAFDLTESARKSRTEKRETLTWNDFSSAGFSRSDAPLSATLQFSTPVASSIHGWPNQSAELHRKLKKAQKALPTFGWDTTPIIGQEESIEEGFLEIFTSLIYGGGWMDRTEGAFRECNWAMVEFKAMPERRPTMPPSGDPRTDSILLLFEEFVPQEYRDQLAAPKKKRFVSTALLVASLNPKSRAWKPAPTLNGRPYVVGNIPKSPSTRELDFENMLRNHQGPTKVISLTRGITSPNQATPTATLNTVSLLDPPAPPLPVSSSAPVKDKSSSVKNRFKLVTKRSGGMLPSEYDNIDFETREASDSEGSIGAPDGLTNGHKKRESKDDAWIDILVADNGRRRMPGQDAELKTGRRRGISQNRSDPELAREEMAKALAKAGVPPPDDDYPIHAQPPTSVLEHINGGERTYVEEVLPDPEPYPYSNQLIGRPSFESDDLYSPRDGPDIRVQSPSTIASLRLRGDEIDGGDFGTRLPLESPPMIPERSSNHETSIPGGKKTNVSSLIEMYQQKSTSESTKPAVHLDSSKNGAPELDDTPGVSEPIPGRISPARYVHGAPLHNVLEEEEED